MTHLIAFLSLVDAADHFVGMGAIYAIALRADAGPLEVAELFIALIATSTVIFIGYSILFSAAPIARGYLRMRLGFEVAFGDLFGVASLKLLTTKLAP